MNYLYVGLGGFLGANARYILVTWLTPRLISLTGWSVPFGTAFVNITGSLVLALFLTIVAKNQLSDDVRLFIATGFFGAYTTFSSYAVETIALFNDGKWLTGIGYIVATNGLCLAGVILGIAMARWALPTS
jgi:CrcB protein